jgi:ferredoxin
MNTSLLRRVRIVVSLIFFTATTLLFMDFLGIIPPSVSNGILFLQFVPSTLKIIVAVSFSAVGFAIVLLLTILFGRVYCSSICPLGVMQDFVNWFSGKTKKKNKRKRRFDFLKEQKILRLVLLAIPILMFLFGSAFTLNLLDPYSIYGRIAGNLFRPVIILANNIGASILEKMRIYTFTTYDLKAIVLVPFIITAVFFIFVVYMSWKKGRLYCNTVCPVGTLLGYLSKISLFKIVINKEECLSCGICAKECKASCIDSKNKSVDATRCVMCFDCITTCPSDGITYNYVFTKKEPVDEPKKNSNLSIDQSKRNFIAGTSLYFLSLSTLTAQVAKNIKVTKLSKIPILRKSATSPPGSLSVERFNAKCTACHLCVGACPTQVLQSSFLEYGFLGMLQPRMDNNAGFCNFECKICGEVCPTGAIMPMKLESKKLAQIGKAKFIKDNCIVNTQKTDCGACSEHCPTKAVHMIPFEKNLFIPEVREDFCVGCGACEYACPVKPYRAIYVEGNRVHQLAKKNVEQKKEVQVSTTEEFPF